MNQDDLNYLCDLNNRAVSMETELHYRFNSHEPINQVDPQTLLLLLAIRDATVAREGEK